MAALFLARLPGRGSFAVAEAGSCVPVQLPVLDDPESRLCVFLAEYRDPVDRERLETDCGKTVAQHRQDGPASLAVKPSRKRHMEAEFFHDIGISQRSRYSRCLGVKSEGFRRA